MELNEFKTRLAEGRLGGCYMFLGEEDYLKKYYLAKLRSAAVPDEAFAPFNHSVYEGAEVSFASIRDDITAPPMMGDFKLIEWRYPDFSKMKESDLVLLEETLVLLEQYPEAILAFLVGDGDADIGTAKRPGRFMKRFGQKAGLLVFNRSTDAQLLSWLRKHFEAGGVSADSDAVKELLFRSGHSMTVLNSEVEKLCAYAAARGKTVISSEDVALVASSTPEADTFAMSNAILARSKRDAYLALMEMKLRRLDPLMIIGMMARTYSELAEVIMLLGDGLDVKDIQTELNMNEFKLRHYITAARKFTPEKITNILKELTRVDTGAKFGGIVGYTAIELFIGKCL